MAHDSDSERARRERDRKAEERRTRPESQDTANRREMADARVVQLTAERALAPPQPGWRRLGSSIAADARLVVAWAEAGFAQNERVAEDGSIQRWEVRTGEPSDLAVLVYGAEGVEQFTTIRHSTAKYPAVDLLPGGNVVVVDKRCGPLTDGTLPDNAYVYDVAGGQLRSFHVGDGVQTIQCTPSGRIWVGYFDEGVFGNGRWRELLGRRPPSSTGLAQFNDQGDLEWSIDDPSILQSIADIYAVNVDDEIAWACPYTEFPIVQVDGGRITSWATDVTGADALLVEGHAVALVGGYEVFRNQRVVMGELTAKGFDRTEILRLAMPDGSQFDKKATVLGRGRSLVVVTDTGWHTLSINELIT